MYMTRILNMAKSENDEAKNVREIYIYSQIEHDGMHGISAKKLAGELVSENADRFDVHINSEGGDVYDGIAIFNLLKNCALPVNIYIDGLCASAASIIAMAGHVHMRTGSIMMIHNPFTIAVGDSEELRDTAEVLDKVRDSIIDAYMTKTSLSRETIIDLMNRETYMNAQTAKELGFCDEIDEDKQEEPEPEQAQEQEPEEKSDSEAAKTSDTGETHRANGINFFAFGNRSKSQRVQDEQEQAINLMAGFINGKRNH